MLRPPLPVALLLVSTVLPACSLPIRQQVAAGEGAGLTEPAEPAKSTRAPDRFGEGFYVGLRYGTFSIGDDFDGETALVGPDDLIVVPTFADAGGIGYAIGAGGRGTSIDLYYETADHNGSFLGVDVDGTLTSCGIRGRLGSPNDWSGGRVATHFLIGVGFHSLSMPEGSSDGVVVGEGELTGLGFDVGVGASVALHNHLTFFTDYFYRCITFTNGSGVVGDDVPLGDDLDSVEPVLMFGLNLVF